MTDQPAGPALETVRALTAAAGLRPAEDELAALAAAYPRLRAAADRLYPVAADADPAPTFDPLPLLGPAPEAGQL
jgi:hypothetical protein